MTRVGASTSAPPAMGREDFLQSLALAGLKVAVGADQLVLLGGAKYASCFCKFSSVNGSTCGARGCMRAPGARGRTGNSPYFLNGSKPPSMSKFSEVDGIEFSGMLGLRGQDDVGDIKPKGSCPPTPVGEMSLRGTEPNAVVAAPAMSLMEPTFEKWLLGESKTVADAAYGGNSSAVAHLAVECAGVPPGAWLLGVAKPSSASGG
eukprot:CAMPEP_0176248302 /NCGR_PEP_ID=MMETSP0121_2-20121125/33398_1 /TAXON_ID=160619 /ORGANISM="Kryptoperidinium foliaceum, Strain CCMP 1326" /LENGTH=204 /DNA_ID=CAMNT_0017587979 /DNA_START=131 /DNA_END=742 /DNA_ORIENTATION=-